MAWSKKSRAAVTRLWPRLPAAYSCSLPVATLPVNCREFIRPPGVWRPRRPLRRWCFSSVPIAGIRNKGVLAYIKHYFRPNPLLMPLHVISELSRTLALAVRLFGNIMSGHLVVGLLVALAGFLVPTPIMALDLLIGLLQAYIFAVLSTVYIGAAIGAGEE